MIGITVPISLVVTLLGYFGVVNWFSDLLGPFFKFIGLRGESGLVFVTSAFLNIYSAIAVISGLTFSYREITILAMMCLISHNLIVETSIQRKTGSRAWQMFLLRIVSSFAMALVLNWLLPENMSSIATHARILNSGLTLPIVLQNWAVSSGWLVAKILIIIVSLMILQKIMEEWGVLQGLTRIFAPLMKIMGLPEGVSFLWIISNVIGLTYGSAVLIDQVQSGKISKTDADLLNHHVGVSHSLLEDTLLFAAIGVSAFWITIPRVAWAILVVWVYRLIRKQIA
jgi:spore maturation protein SpmB